ncbi:hypothetical protein JW868_02360 [Candidatus Woesearchaeota archaeon]|nr:hypothetical protein [Candidatus Woesearchaeota archaeon]
MEEFKKGKRGVTFLGHFEGKEAIVKKVNPEADTDRLFIEARFLKLLEGRGIAPVLYDFRKNELVMEYIDGELINDYLEHTSRSHALSMIRKILRQCYILDKLRVNKYELTNPYKHIIVRDGKPVHIDFERCKFTLAPKNVSQFCQFITKKNITRILESNRIALDKERIMKQVRVYKEEYKKVEFDRLLKLIK